MTSALKKPIPNLANNTENDINEEQFFDIRITEIIALNHHVFNEREAAFYCRCSVDSIRYHALRSRKLTFCDFTKEGLVFLKTDLDNFLQSSRKEGYRGH